MNFTVRAVYEKKKRQQCVITSVIDAKKQRSSHYKNSEN